MDKVPISGVGERCPYTRRVSGGRTRPKENSPRTDYKVDVQECGKGSQFVVTG